MKAYFLGQAWMADHETFSKVNLKYTKWTFPVGQARCSFHLPHSYNLQILLARGNGASTNVEPCTCWWDKQQVVYFIQNRKNPRLLYGCIANCVLDCIFFLYTMQKWEDFSFSLWTAQRKNLQLKSYHKQLSTKPHICTATSDTQTLECTSRNLWKS